MAYFTINNPDWDGNEWICAPSTPGMHDAAYDVIREPCLPIELRPPYLGGIRLTEENGMDDASHMHRVMYCGRPNSIFFEEPLFPYILSDNDVVGKEGKAKKYDLKGAWYNESELDDKNGHIPYPLTPAVKQIAYAFDTGEYGYDHVIVPGNSFQASEAMNASTTLDKVTAASVLSDELMIPVLRVKDKFDPEKVRCKVHFTAPPVWGQFIPSYDVTITYDRQQLPWWAYQVTFKATEDPAVTDVILKIAGIKDEIVLGTGVETVPFDTLKTEGKFDIPDPRGVMFRRKIDKEAYEILSFPRGITALVPDVLAYVEYKGKKYPLNCIVVDTNEKAGSDDPNATRYEWKDVKYVVCMDGDNNTHEIGIGVDYPAVVFEYK